MTIDQRLEDAEFLWQSGRYEGAFLMALIAFAATARKAHPNEKSDSKAFERLFQDQFRSGLSVRFRDDLLPMSRIFYKWLRCHLVHEAGLPPGLEIDAEDVSGLCTIALIEGLPVAISATWYHSLVIGVISHPVNSDVFPGQEELLSSKLEQRRAAGQRVLGVPARLIPEFVPNSAAATMEPVEGETIDLSKRSPG